MCNHGLEALHAIAPPFNLVIPAGQMPVMDGFALTRNLSAHNHELLSRGFTAYAQPRKRERCRVPWPEHGKTLNGKNNRG